MYTIYLQFKLYIFIPNNIRKHKSFLGKIIHSRLQKSLKKLVKHSFSKLFGKQLGHWDDHILKKGTPNEFPTRDAWREYALRKVLFLACISTFQAYLMILIYYS